MLKMQRPRHWKLIVPFVPVPIFDGIRFISWVAGVAVGPLIVIKEQVADNECVLVHELTHVQQWWREPLLMPLKYIYYWLRYGYWDNPYEVEAFANQRRCLDGTFGWVE